MIHVSIIEFLGKRYEAIGKKIKILRWQLCPCHDNWAVMKWANLWPELVIRFKTRRTGFQWLSLWVHKLEVKWAPCKFLCRPPKPIIQWWLIENYKNYTMAVVIGLHTLLFCSDRLIDNRNCSWGFVNDYELVFCKLGWWDWCIHHLISWSTAGLFYGVDLCIT